jgi:hypothetical protein
MGRSLHNLWIILGKNRCKGGLFRLTPMGKFLLKRSLPYIFL